MFESPSLLEGDEPPGPVVEADGAIPQPLSTYYCCRFFLQDMKR